MRRAISNALGFGRSSSGGGGGGGPSFPDAFPLEIPDPVIWFTARNVTLDGSGNITSFTNIGSAGATYNATWRSAGSTAYAKVATPAAWGGREVIDVTIDANKIYDHTSLGGLQTAMAIVRYKDGVDSSFDTFNSVNGGQPELIGNGSTADLFPTSGAVLYIDGALGSTGFLPTGEKKTFTHTRAAAGALTGFLSDDFGTSRKWVGYVGDYLVWDSVLTADQIAALHTEMMAYYAAS